MERNYKGFEISQPERQQTMGQTGNKLTSLLIKAPGVNNNQPIKVIAYKRNDLKELEKALQKAENFIDDHLLIGKTAEVFNGKRAGERATVEAVSRKVVKGKSLRSFVVAFNVKSITGPTFDTYKEEDIKIIEL